MRKFRKSALCAVEAMPKPRLLVMGNLSFPTYALDEMEAGTILAISNGSVSVIRTRADRKAPDASQSSDAGPAPAGS